MNTLIMVLLVLAIIWLAVPVVLLLLACSANLSAKMGARVRHWKTRHTPPAVGQRWAQDDGVLEIREILGSGALLIRAGGSGSSITWSETREEWRARVDARRLYLLSDD